MILTDKIETMRTGEEGLGEKDDPIQDNDDDDNDKLSIHKIKRVTCLKKMEYLKKMMRPQLKQLTTKKKIR